MLKDTVRKRIKFHREERGLTQGQLAERLGYKKADQIARIEHGKKEITLTMITEFAEALKVSEEDLVTDIYGLQIKGWKGGFEVLMLFAYRYAINRHPTQAMRSIETIILENLNMVHDEFLRQMIQGILDDKRWEQCCKERREKEEADFFYRLKSHAQDYERYLKDEKGKDVQEMHGLLLRLIQLCETVQLSEKHYLPDPYMFSTEYLDNMLEQLQQEYERRGYKRIVDEV